MGQAKEGLNRSKGFGIMPRNYRPSLHYSLIEATRTTRKKRLLVWEERWKNSNAGKPPGEGKEQGFKGRDLHGGSFHDCGMAGGRESRKGAIMGLTDGLAFLALMSEFQVHGHSCFDSYIF